MVRRFNILMIMIFALAAFANSAFGETYYVARTGNDNNTGTSWATAWTTVAKVNATITHGDTVRFGTGDWYASQFIPVSGNTAADPTVYACSTNSIDSKGLTEIWSGDLVETWTLYSGNVYQADWTPSAEHGNFVANYPCIVGGDSIYVPVLSAGSVTNAGYFYYDPAGDILYIYPYIAGDPDVTGHRILASAQPVVHFNDSIIRYTEFFGLNLKMGAPGTIYFSENWRSDFNSFIHCNIAHATHGPANNASVIGSFSYGNPGEPDTLDGFYYGNSFRACSIYSATSAMGQNQTSHAGSGFTLYGQRQWIIDSCYFYSLPGAGIMFKGGGNDYYGNRVSYSVFDGTDSMPYGQASFTKLGVETACGADRDSVYGCIFKNFFYSGAGAIGMAEGDCNPAMSFYYGGDFFCNNTMYNCNMFFYGRVEPPENDLPVTIKYNVMQKVLSGSSRWVSDSDKPIFSNPAWCVIDSNYWYDPSYAFLFYDGSSRNWTYWTGTLGYDTHGYNSDPGLADPVNDDFSRPDASQEMNLYYGGRTWTKFGAIQGIPSPDTTAPELNNIRSTDTTSNSVNIRWDTNERATSQVEYGTTIDYDSSTQLDPSLVYSHVQTITDLLSLTTYHYRVRSVDAAGNETISGDYTFRTLAPDTIPPVISGVAAGNVSSYSALIEWTTNEIATSQVDYGFTTGYGQSSDLDPALVINHNVALSGLQSDTLYHFRVRSLDAAGNEALSGDFTFHTDTVITLILISDSAYVTVSGTYPGYSIIAINDRVVDPRGGIGTTWASDQSSSPHWVEMDFGYPKTPSRVKIHWAWNSSNSSWMCSEQYYVQYYDTYSNSYVDLAFVDNNPVDSTTTSDFPPVRTNRIRYFQPADMGPPNYSSILWVTEMEIYGEAGIPAPDPIGTEIILEDSSAIVIANPVNIQMAIFYEFALDVDSTYPNPRIEPPLIIDTVISTTYDRLSSEYTYYWRCRAIASDLSDTSAWSYSENFNLILTSTEQASEIKPEDGSTVESSYQTFEIKFYPISEYVYFEVDGDLDFFSPLRSGPIRPNNEGLASWQPDSVEISAEFKKNGVYYWRASVDNANWSEFTVTVKLDIHAFPVPFRTSEDHTRITFTNLPESSTISVASVSGTIVFTKSGVGPGEWVWDVKNDRGSDLASGVYLYAVDSKGGAAQGKIVVIR